MDAKRPMDHHFSDLEVVHSNYSDLEVAPSQGTAENITKGNLQPYHPGVPHESDRLGLLPYHPGVPRESDRLGLHPYHPGVSLKAENDAPIPVDPNSEKVKIVPQKSSKSRFFGTRKRRIWSVGIVLLVLVVLGAILGAVLGKRDHHSDVNNTPTT